MRSRERSSVPITSSALGSGFMSHTLFSSLLFSCLSVLGSVQGNTFSLSSSVLGSGFISLLFNPFFANANLVWVCQLYSIPSQFLRRSLPLLSTMSAMSPGDCKEHMERQRPTPLRTTVSKGAVSKAEPHLLAVYLSRSLCFSLSTNSWTFFLPTSLN